MTIAVDLGRKATKQTDYMTQLRSSRTDYISAMNPKELRALRGYSPPPPPHEAKKLKLLFPEFFFLVY